MIFKLDFRKRARLGKYHRERSKRADVLGWLGAEPAEAFVYGKIVPCRADVAGGKHLDRPMGKSSLCPNARKGLCTDDIYKIGAKRGIFGNRMHGGFHVRAGLTLISQKGSVDLAIASGKYAGSQERGDCVALQCRVLRVRTAGARGV